ncbi:hypothetical protein B5P19_09440 [Clavibacter sepedonicus]|uniref:Lipoprotein n=2 Tax=Clavibacter sepedonicus TaxID=31964 RepID=B0RC60_CLASE|nr:hypothetical protein B5P19_09440 [Clavibacter sepedonicus]CAQ02946.1 putative lipoprotein [Clavibacter sepedonicus]
MMMQIGARWALASAVVAACLLGGGPATAAGSAPRPALPPPAARGEASSGDIVDATVESPGETASDVSSTEYWTPERMRTAIEAPVPTSLSDPGHPDASGVPDEESGSAAVARMETLAQPAAPTSAAVGPQAFEEPRGSAVVGRVFYTDPGEVHRYACSGVAINTPSGRVVMTAGHCVHTGQGGGWQRHWEFVPGYVDGRAPFGHFPEKHLLTSTAWITKGSEGPIPSDVAATDIGFAVTAPDPAGRSLGSIVGGDGLTIGAAPSGLPIELLAYPVNRLGGARLSACRTSTVDSGHAGVMAAEGCGFEGGGSGGPWVDRFDAKTGRGFVRGVTSGSAGEVYLEAAVPSELTKRMLAQADRDGRG